MGGFRVALAASVLLGMACSGVRVQVEASPSMDAASLGSYAWVSPREEIAAHPALDAAALSSSISELVETALAAGGHPRVSRGEASFLVSYSLDVETKIDPYAQTEDEEIRWGPGPSRAMVVEGVDPEFEQATARLLIFLPGAEEPAWRGTARLRLESHHSPEKNGAAIHSAFGQLLDELPRAQSGGAKAAG